MSQADSKAAGFDEMKKLSEKVESLNETERAELAFNRFNNFKSAVDNAIEIADQNNTDTGTTSKTNNQEPPKATPEKLITDPIVEKAIRKAAKKPTGELTKADLEKVTSLSLKYNQLTEVPKGLEKLTQLTKLYLYGNQLTDVKGLEKLTQLERLVLHHQQLTDLKDNPDLTKAQIAELQKALPKCDIN